MEKMKSVIDREKGKKRSSLQASARVAELEAVCDELGRQLEIAEEGQEVRLIDSHED